MTSPLVPAVRHPSPPRITAEAKSSDRADGLPLVASPPTRRGPGVPHRSAGRPVVGDRPRPIGCSTPAVGDPTRPVGCPPRPVGDPSRPVGDPSRPVGGSTRAIGRWSRSVGRRPVLPVLSLVGLLAFVALAFVARPAPSAVLVGGGPTHVGQVAGGHPDFVGVAESRPSVGSAHLLGLTPSPSLLAVALLATASALVVGRSAAQQARWRRWRARLEGAPPLVA